jgi:hypothetical protein
MNPEAEQMPTHGYQLGSRRFDWAVAGLSAWLIGGLYLDDWAHSHGKVGDVFFTPWHAILYGADVHVERSAHGCLH